MTDEKKKGTIARSFRISAENDEKIKALAKDLDVSQDGAIQALIDAYEVTQAAISIPERKTEIENFRVKASELIEAYLHSLQLNVDAETRIRADYQAALDRNAQTIDTYQAEVASLKAQLKDATELAGQAAGLQAELDEVKDQARKAKDDAAERLAEKERLIRNLDGQIVDLTAKAEGYPELKAEKDDITEKLREARQAVKDAKKDHDLELAQAAAAAERDKSAALAEAKDVAAKVEHELRDQILAATQEIGALREQIAVLKGELAQAKATKQES